MEKITINKKQAREIALAIFADIERYVNEHELEYEKFCKKENLKERSSYEK